VRTLGQRARDTYRTAREKRQQENATELLAILKHTFGTEIAREELSYNEELPYYQSPDGIRVDTQFGAVWVTVGYNRVQMPTGYIRDAHAALRWLGELLVKP
jgi:hypothetical protein